MNYGKYNLPPYISPQFGNILCLLCICLKATEEPITVLGKKTKIDDPMSLKIDVNDAMHRCTLYDDKQ